MTFPALNSNTPKRYQFKLISANKTILCDPEPIEWSSGIIEFNRDLDVGGVFGSMALDTITFLGNGANLLKELYTAYEMNAVCTLVIYWWKKSIRDYVEFPNRYNINFNYYEIAQVNKSYFGVRVKAVNSSFHTNLTNREDVKVNTTSLLSIGNIAIADYYPPFKKGLYYQAINDNYIGVLYILRTFSTGFSLPHLKHVVSYTSIPLDIKVNDSFDAQLQPVKYVTQIPLTSLSQVPSFFVRANYDYDFEIGRAHV